VNLVLKYTQVADISTAIQNNINMKSVKGLFTLSTVCFLLQDAVGLNIVMFSIYGSKSHENMFTPTAKALLARGHNVTFYASYKPETQPGLKLYEISIVAELLAAKSASLFTPEGIISPDDYVSGLYSFLDVACRAVYKHEDMQALVKSGILYDVALVDATFNDCFLPIASEVSKSIMFIGPSDMFNYLAWSMNVPFPFAYIPDFMRTPTPKMNFLEKMRNVYVQVYDLIYRNYVLFPRLDVILREEMPGLKSNIFEAQKRVSFYLINKHPAFDGSVPTMPYIKYIGGIHIQKTKPLPKDLESFANGSGDAGFIYVSFGTRVSGQTLPKHAKEAFVEAFSRLPQRVIWKFSGTLSGLSSNVKLVDWAPQQDILAHPKIRGFITHGGRFSMLETIYHAVPVIGMPIATDQPFNALRAEDLNIGLALSWSDVTAEKLLKAIDTIVNDTSLSNTVKKHQSLIKDNQVDPADIATYWIEYVARHNGALHLRSAAEHLNLAQYFLLDVIAVVLLVIVITTYVTYKCIAFAVKSCCGKRKSKKKRE